MSDPDPTFTLAERIKRALDSCRDAGVMGGFHSEDADRCVLCGWTKMHRDQLSRQSCGRDVNGEHLTLGEILIVLQRTEAETQNA
mgnify:CR=1 FL=1